MCLCCIKVGQPAAASAKRRRVWMGATALRPASSSAAAPKDHHHGQAHHFEHLGGDGREVDAAAGRRAALYRRREASGRDGKAGNNGWRDANGCLASAGTHGKVKECVNAGGMHSISPVRQAPEAEALDVEQPPQFPEVLRPLLQQCQQHRHAISCSAACTTAAFSQAHNATAVPTPAELPTPPPHPLHSPQAG